MCLFNFLLCIIHYEIGVVFISLIIIEKECDIINLFLNLQYFMRAKYQPHLSVI